MLYKRFKEIQAVFNIMNTKELMKVLALCLIVIISGSCQNNTATSKISGSELKMFLNWILDQIIPEIVKVILLR